LETLKEPRDAEGIPTLHAVLPPELLNFLNRRSYSLLIKGEAATGKTILALSILKELGAGSNYLYLSTRVSPAQLFQDHLWLSEFTKTLKPEHGEPAEAQDAQDIERFVDSRLDEPVPFFERITNELMDVRAPTIVVDSWDPIRVMMEEDALLSNVKVLQTWRERAQAKIVVLIEDSSDATADSLFDGVVALDRYYEEGRIIRMIQLTKLSGIKVNRPSYLFTLDGGIFQSFRTYNPLEIDAQNPASWSWQRRAHSTGYRLLDALLDGTLPSGTITNLNLSSGVNSAMVILVLSGILGQGALRSRALFFKPFEGVGLEHVGGALGKVIPIQQSRSRGDGHAAKGWAESLKAQVEKERRAKPGKKVVVLVGSEFLRNADEEDDRERLLELMKSAVDLTVIVNGGETPFESAARASDVSLKLSDINGTPVLRGQVPWTEHFAISVKADQDPAMVSLAPMV
jgi:KaiC/GvpD/RAD55 family RecA-like ATPase